MAAANAEIHSVRTSLGQEATLAKNKLARAESKIAGLERSVEAKASENAELARICDELVAQIEGAAAAK